MPFAQIYMIEGRTEEQKRAVIEKVTQALVEASGAPGDQRARLDPRDAEGGKRYRRATAKDLGR